MNDDGRLITLLFNNLFSMSLRDRRFVESVYTYFENNGEVSTKQRAVLEKIKDNNGIKGAWRTTETPDDFWDQIDIDDDEDDEQEEIIKEKPAELILEDNSVIQELCFSPRVQNLRIITANTINYSGNRDPKDLAVSLKGRYLELSLKEVLALKASPLVDATELKYLIKDYVRLRKYHEEYYTVNKSKVLKNLGGGFVASAFVYEALGYVFQFLGYLSGQV